jgi:hypothetical protein
MRLTLFSSLFVADDIHSFVHSFAEQLFFLRDWDLNSGPHPCQAGALPLEAIYQLLH